MESLDADTLLLIFNQLDPADIFRISNVCLKFRNLVIHHRSSLPHTGAVRIDIIGDSMRQISRLTAEETLPCLTLARLKLKLLRAYRRYHDSETINDIKNDLRQAVPEKSLVILKTTLLPQWELNDLVTILDEKHSTVVDFEIAFRATARTKKENQHSLPGFVPLLPTLLKEAIYCDIHLFQGSVEERCEYGEILKVLKNSQVLGKLRSLKLSTTVCCSDECRADMCNSKILFSDQFLRNSKLRTLSVQLPSALSIREDFFNILVKILKNFVDGKSGFTRTTFYSWRFFVDKYEQKLTKELLSILEEVQKFAIHLKEGYHFCLRDPSGFVLCVAYNSEGISIFRCISCKDSCVRRNRVPKRFCLADNMFKITSAQRKKLDEQLQIKGVYNYEDW